MSAALAPGSELGVFGGGQLGRMFALAAARLGYRVAVFAPEGGSPTGQVAHRAVRAAYSDLEAVEEFARSVDVVTFEFENVPADTIAACAKHAPVRPPGELLHASQERLREKAALVQLGLPVAEHRPITNQTELDAAVAGHAFPAVLKTAAWGYDGKGQVRVAAAADLERAWGELERAPAVLESFVPFESELSVVAARGLDGSLALYEPMRNVHENHILDVTVFPAQIAAGTRDQAHEIARTLLEGFDVCGVLCVELFLMADGSLLVNEIAPRPHNSGHVTIDAHVSSQFENQVRAVCGLPLGSVEPLAPAGAMANLLGDLWDRGEPDWSAALARPGVRLHLYGKGEARPGRKMGHLSVLAPSADEAERRIREARASLLS